MRTFFAGIFAAALFIVGTPRHASSDPLFYQDGEEGTSIDAFRNEIDREVKSLPLNSRVSPSFFNDFLVQVAKPPELSEPEVALEVRVHIFPMLTHLKGERIPKYFPIEEPGDLYEAPLDLTKIKLTAEPGSSLHVYRNSDKAVLGDGPSLAVNLKKNAFQLGTHTPQKFENLSVIQGPNDVTRVEWKTANGTRSFDYYGSFNILKDATPKREPCVRVVNVVALERYVADVTPAEMNPAEFDMEGLKTQAASSRGFVLFFADARTDLSYDIFANTQGQYYPGIKFENEKTNQAVAETAGMVVMYKGKPAMTAYGQNSGGRTLDICDSGHCSGAVPYLKSVPEINVAAIRKFPGGEQPHHFVTTELARKFIAADLAQKTSATRIGFSDSDVISITPLKHNKSERVTAVEVRGPKSSVVVTGSHLPLLISALGTDRYILSPAIAVGGAMDVIDHGAGPQVGMCQYCAGYMAQKGLTFDKILHHYYPNTQIFDSKTGKFDIAL